MSCWTLFLNAANFKGPVAYRFRNTGAGLSRNYHTIDGRGLDARPALMAGGAMEFNTVPYFESANSQAPSIRDPKLLFPVDKDDRTVLMLDVTMYSAPALSDSVRQWVHGGFIPNGLFDTTASWPAHGKANPITFRQGPKNCAVGGIRG